MMTLPYPKVLFSLVATKIADNIWMTALLQHLNFTSNFLIAFLLKKANISIIIERGTKEPVGIS